MRGARLTLFHPSPNRAVQTPASRSVQQPVLCKTRPEVARNGGLHHGAAEATGILQNNCDVPRNGIGKNGFRKPRQKVLRVIEELPAAGVTGWIRNLLEFLREVVMRFIRLCSCSLTVLAFACAAFGLEARHELCVIETKPPTVVVVDTQQGKVVEKIPVEKNPTYAVAGSSGRFLYVLHDQRSLMGLGALKPDAGQHCGP